MSESAEKVASQVRFEIEQIDRLFKVYTDLLERVHQHTPDMVEVTAVASVLHSFYNGLENIFLSIAKSLDQQVPTGAQWHRELLDQMSQQRTNRGSVISIKLAQKLVDYLGFRHFCRHSYSFFLEWDEQKNLVMPLRGVWAEVKKELQAFLKSLS